MTVNDKPLLLIDVDGPLNPYANSNNQLRKTTSSKSNTPPSGRYHLYKLLGFKVWLNRWHGEQLLALADYYELVWATTWKHHANSLIAPRVGLPELPVIDFDESDDKRPASDRLPGGVYWKTPQIVEYAAGRPFAWVDDEITEFDDAYVDKHHDGPAKLKWINPRAGLRQPDFDALAVWAQTLTPDVPRETSTPTRNHMTVINNLRQLAQTVAAETGESERLTEQTLRAGFTALARMLAADEQLSIPNFGTFRVRERAARTARNPQTGEAVALPARKVPTFRPTGRLLTMVDDGDVTETIRKRPQTKR